LPSTGYWAASVQQLNPRYQSYNDVVGFPQVYYGGSDLHSRHVTENDGKTTTHQFSDNADSKFPRSVTIKTSGNFITSILFVEPIVANDKYTGQLTKFASKK